jgi:ferrochelatase
MTATLLVHFGSPRDRAEVAPFINAIFADHFGPLARVLAFPARRSALKKYDAVGFGGAEGMDELARRLGGDFFVASQYGTVSIEDALSKIEEKGLEEAAVVPLYPHASLEMYDLIFKKMERLRKLYFRDMRFSWAGPFYDHPLFVDAWAESIEKSLGEFENRNSTAIIFSAHAVPSDAGYEKQVLESARLIGLAIGLEKQAGVAYQSAMGKRWSSPSIEEELSRLARNGVRDCLIVPISFLFDNVETLFDIDRVAIPAAKSAGMRDVRRATPPGHSENIIQMILEVAKGWYLSL